MFKKDKERYEKLLYTHSKLLGRLGWIKKGVELFLKTNPGVEKDIYRDAIIKRLQWFFVIFVPYLEKYLRFVVALPHQEVKNMVRELLRVGKITQEETEVFLNFLDDYYVLANNEYDILFANNIANSVCKNINVFSSVLEKMKPKLDREMGFLV